MKVTLFFTKNVSLLDWKNSGILDREIQLYKEMEEKFDLEYDFITYGNAEDFKIIDRFKVIPLNKNFTRSIKIATFKSFPEQSQRFKII